MWIMLKIFGEKIRSINWNNWIYTQLKEATKRKELKFKPYDQPQTRNFIFRYIKSNQSFRVYLNKKRNLTHLKIVTFNIFWYIGEFYTFLKQFSSKFDKSLI